MIATSISGSLSSTARTIGGFFQSITQRPRQTIPSRDIRDIRAAAPALQIDRRDENDVTTLMISGDLGPRTYRELITIAEAAHADDQHRLVVDMAGVSHLGVAGLFALHNVVRVFEGRDLLDPEMGWSALGQMSDEAPRTMPSTVRLVNLQPAVEKVWGSVSGQ